MILVDARMVGARTHGIARYAENLVPALRAAAPDLELAALVGPSLPADSPLRGGRTIETRIPLYSVREQILLPPLLRSIGPDLFHSLTYALPRAADLPKIPTIHDLIHLAFPGDHTLLHRAYYRAVVGPEARAAPRVITVSHATADAIARTLGVDRGRIVVTPLGSPPPFAADGGLVERVAARLGLPRDFVLYVGNPRPHKNAAGAVRIHDAAARACGMAIGLALVGVASQSAGVGGSAQRVVPIPQIAEEDLRALYAGAKALLIPSWDEGFGLPALEAMAAGTPVVASRRGALPEVVGDAGLLVDPADEAGAAEALARVLSDGALAADLRERSRRRAALFTWEGTARGTLAAYGAALAAAVS